MECYECRYAIESDGYDYECTNPSLSHPTDCKEQSCDGCKYYKCVDSYTYYTCGLERCVNYEE